MQLYKILYTTLCFTLLLSCNNTIKEYTTVHKTPKTTPIINECTIPPNIAPINISFPGKCLMIISLNEEVIERHTFTDRTDFSAKEWSKLLQKGIGSKLELTIYQQNDSTKQWSKFLPINLRIAKDSIDSHIAYRLIEPSYEAFRHMGIYQRSLENFDEKAIILNSHIKSDGCLNCHNFNNYNPNQFLFHFRSGKDGGTAIINNGKLQKIDLKTGNNISAGAYPSWHPSGKYITFSTNTTHQAFHASGDKRVEVYDLASDLILYDIEDNRVINTPILQVKDLWETFPSWSPDGDKLYFCRAEGEEMPTDYKDLQYGIYSIDFDQKSGTFSNKIDTLIQSDQQSYLFPRISPDGKFLLYTKALSGTFPIWHHEADLEMIDLKSKRQVEISKINSNRTESYHSWSSNGRWIMFSSRRENSLYTRVYFAYFDKDGNVHKPFILPQEDEDYYTQKLQSYNLPEFISGEIEVSPYDLEELFEKPATPTKL